MSYLSLIDSTTCTQMGLQWQLTAEEKDRIHAEARRRQAINECQGLKGRNKGAEKGPMALRMHTLGAGGEMAVASYLNLKDEVFGDVVASRGSHDLPPDIDVKTRPFHRYDLICQLDEEPSKTLVLVTVENREVILQGWTKAWEAMQAQWRQEYVKGRPCYFMPKQYLRPIQSLKDYVENALLF